MLYTVDTALSVLALFCRIFDTWWPIILQRRGRDFAESDVDAKKLNKRDMLKCKERKREREREREREKDTHARARTHARMHARARAFEREKKEEIKEEGEGIRSGETERKKKG